MLCFLNPNTKPFLKLDVHLLMISLNVWPYCRKIKAIFIWTSRNLLYVLGNILCETVRVFWALLIIKLWFQQKCWIMGEKQYKPSHYDIIFSSNWRFWKIGKIGILYLGSSRREAGERIWGNFEDEYGERSEGLCCGGFSGKSETATCFGGLKLVGETFVGSHLKDKLLMCN